MKHAKTQKWLSSAAKKPGALKAWFLLFGVLAMVLSPFAIAQTTHAQGSNAYIAQDVFDDVVSYAYRNAFGACLGSDGHIDDTRPVSHQDNNGNGTPDDEEDQNGNGIKDGEEPDIITADAIVDGRWFWGGGNGVAVTPLVDDDGMRDCNTEALINRAVEHWWQRDSSYNIEGACQLGLIERIKDGENCVHGEGDFLALRVERSDVLSAIDAQRWGGDWSWNGPRYYVLYARSMEIGCYATPVIAAADVTSADDRQRYSTEEYVNMQVVGRDGSTTEMIYRLGNDKLRNSGDVYTTVSPNDFVDQHYTCGELAELANRYAPDYAQYVKDNPPAEDDPGAGAGEGEGGGENATQCDVEGVGWFVCPAMIFMGDVVDGAYGVVAGFLAVEPVSTDTGGPLFQAWSFMRNFANVAFVIVFLIIIYSQITSAGISNYNIKKMLPRLIVAAILVNVSYWICAIAVDVSNILGASIKDLFDSVSGELFPTTPNLTTPNAQWAPVIIGIIGGAVAATVALYAGLSMLLPLLLGALISVITALIILTLRQALIIILIVLSPLAFVAFLLPNTQSLFDKWRKLFVTLLFMFPLVAIIFGGSALAGLVIQQSAGNDPLLQLLALGVTVIPLFITVFISKMISMIGGVAGRLIGAVNDPSKGLLDRAKRGAEGVRDRQQMRRAGRSLSGQKFLGSDRYKRRAKREAINAGVESEFKRSQSSYIADQAKNDQGFRDRLAGGAGLQSASPEALNRALAGAINVQAKIEADEVTAASAIIRDLNLNEADLRSLSTGGKTEDGRLSGQSFAIRSAAIKKVIDTQDVDGTNNLLNSYGDMDEKTRLAFADHLEASGSRPKYVSNGAIGQLRLGANDKNGLKGHENTGKVSDALIAKALGNNTYSVDKVATTPEDELMRVADVMENSAVPTNNAQIIENAQTAQTDPRFAGQIGKNKAQIQRISGPLPTPPEPTPAPPEATPRASSFRSGSASRGPKR